jgi:hypothetical protein
VRFFGNKPHATRILLVVTGVPRVGAAAGATEQFHVRFHIQEHSMKKLLTLIALVGMGAFMAGCGDEKPAPPAGGSTPPMTGPGSVGSPPKSGATGDKMSDDKAGKGDADADKDDADKDDKKEE